MDALLRILDGMNVRATFFVLGCIAEKRPALIKKIYELGHEIGIHGYGHEFVYKLDPQSFAEDISRSLSAVAECIGMPPTAYRAPYFSITAGSIWAFEILAQHGIEADFSVFPIRNYRYGMPGSPRYPYWLSTARGYLLEIPVSTIRVLRQNLSLTGGFYMRFFPYGLISWSIRKINAQGYPAIVYLHPWELDPDHPQIHLPRRIGLTHYYRLESTEGKLKRLLSDFRFTSAGEAMSEIREMALRTLSPGEITGKRKQ